MKHLILTALVFLTGLNSTYAARTQPNKNITGEVLTANRKDFNDRMYLYIYCLANTEHPSDFSKATDRCAPVLDKSNAFDSKGLDDRITANIKSLHVDIKDMISCLKTEANRTSNMSDSSAVSFCVTIVKPTSGIEI